MDNDNTEIPITYEGVKKISEEVFNRLSAEKERKHEEARKLEAARLKNTLTNKIFGAAGYVAGTIAYYLYDTARALSDPNVAVMLVSIAAGISIADTITKK